MEAIRQSDVNVFTEDQRTSSTNIPSRLETMVDVLKPAEAKLSAMVDKKTEPEGSCSRCRGSCILLANYRAMG